MEVKSSSNDFTWITFNQDLSRVVIGKKSGFEIWDINPLQHRFSRDESFVGGLCIVEALYRSNILAVIGGGEGAKFSGREVHFWDDRSALFEVSLTFDSPVRAVKLRRDRFAVVLSDQVIFYPMRTRRLEPLRSARTAPNARGLFSFATLKDARVCAYLGMQAGQIVIENWAEEAGKDKRATLDCEGGVSCFNLNQDGSLLAVVDSDGINLRVYSTQQMRCVGLYRRGGSKCEVLSLQFSQDSNWVCLSSNRKTIHVFCLSDHGSKSSQSSLSFLSGVLPASLGGAYAEAKWSFSKIRVNEAHTICAFGPDPSYLYVMGGSGAFAKYQLDLENGGEGRLVFEKKIQ